MIGIGLDMGGTEYRDTLVDHLLMQAMIITDKLRDRDYDDGTEAWINPIFIVPGSIWWPEFEGYELGHFSRKKKGLVVKIAVPELVAKGKGIPAFVGTSLREAVRLAAAHFSSKGISFSTLKAEKIILVIEDRLRDVKAG